MSGNRFLPRSKPSKKVVYAKKSAKQLERHLKGVANHKRIEILFLIYNETGINLEEIAKRLHSNFKTVSEHIRKLTLAGLIDKKYEGHYVKHRLLPYGHEFVKFLVSFSNSAENKNI